MGQAHEILILPGDGIGPEVMTEAIKVLQIFNGPLHTFNLQYEIVGGCSIDKNGTSVTQEVIQAALNADAVLFGAVGGPKWDNVRRGLDGPEGGLLQIRKALDVYANLRPCSADSPSTSISKEYSPYKEKIIQGVDFLVLRENCGGAYFGKKVENEDYGIAYPPAI